MSRTLADVGQLVRTRRQRQRLSIKEASLRAELSDTTWGNVEAGRASSGDTQIGVCRALGWTDDSFERLLRGDDALDDGDGGPRYADSTDYNSRLARMPDHVLQAVNDIIDAEERRRGLS